MVLTKKKTQLTLLFVPPTDGVEEPTIEPIAYMRQSQRSRRDAVPDYYIVYL